MMKKVIATADADILHTLKFLQSRSLGPFLIIHKSTNMKQKATLLTLILIAIFFFGGCKKEKFEQQVGNKSPIANAGADRAIVLPIDSIEINGSGTDSDGTIVKYGWRKINGPIQYTLVTSTDPNLKIRNLVEGTYDFELKVFDNIGASSNDTVKITVIRTTSTNQPPVANAGPDKFLILPVDSIEIIGDGTDIDGSIINYTWRKISGPVEYNILSGNAATTKITNLKKGIYIFELAVTDNGGLIARDSMSVIVNTPINQPPIANAGPNLFISLPIDSVQINGMATDPDGNITSIRWSKISGPSSFFIVNPNTAVTKIRGLIQGVYLFKLEVIDSGNLISSDNVMITVGVSINQPPVVDAGPDLYISLPTDSVQVNGTATDPDGNIISIQWSKVAGPSSFVILNSNEAASKIKNLVLGVYVFKLEVMDSGGLISSDNMTITVVANGCPCFPDPCDPWGDPCNPWDY